MLDNTKKNLNEIEINLLTKDHIILTKLFYFALVHLYCFKPPSSILFLLQ